MRQIHRQPPGNTWLTRRQQNLVEGRLLECLFDRGERVRHTQLAVDCHTEIAESSDVAMEALVRELFGILVEIGNELRRKRDKSVDLGAIELCTCQRNKDVELAIGVLGQLSHSRRQRLTTQGLIGDNENATHGSTVVATATRGHSTPMVWQ